jgi:hypothetical protein
VPTIRDIDASELALVLDRPLADWTADSLRECYLRHGCVIVRGAIAPALIEQARLAIDKAYQRTSEVHIDADAIAAASGGTLTGFELVAHPTLKRFRDLVYSGQLYFQESVTARRIQGSETGLDWQEPLTLHLDAQFHRFRFTMNFWVPLQDCGIDSPSLQMVPLDYLTTRAYSRFTGRRLRDGEAYQQGFFTEHGLDVREVTRAFGPAALLHPIMRTGDLIVASNWLIHGSYRTPQMSQGRVSVELRFIGTDLDIAPHLPPFLKRIAYAVTERHNQNFTKAPSL